MIARALAAAVVVLSLSGPAAAQMRPGQWEITATTEIAGMPPGMPGMGPQRMTHCYSEADVGDPGRMAESAGQEGCTVTKSQQSGAAYEFEMRCANPPATGRGRYTFAADAYEGRMDIEIAEGSEKMAITTRTQGRRLGDCAR